MGRIILSKDGSAFYRVQCDPVDAVPPSFNRPSTYCSHLMASDAAHIFAAATGFPLVDETERGRLHG